MGVFNFSIVIPQIVAAGILGFILRSFFNNDAVFALLVGGGSMILSGLLTLLVDDDDKSSAPEEEAEQIADAKLESSFAE